MRIETRHRSGGLVVNVDFRSEMGHAMKHYLVLVGRVLPGRRRGWISLTWPQWQNRP